jgi:hypothetical protein
MLDRDKRVYDLKKGLTAFLQEGDELHYGGIAGDPESAQSATYRGTNGTSRPVGHVHSVERGSFGETVHIKTADGTVIACDGKDLRTSACWEPTDAGFRAIAAREERKSQAYRAINSAVGSYRTRAAARAARAAAPPAPAPAPVVPVSPGRTDPRPASPAAVAAYRGSRGDGDLRDDVRAIAERLYHVEQRGNKVEGATYSALRGICEDLERMSGPTRGEPRYASTLLREMKRVGRPYASESEPRFQDELSPARRYRPLL